MVDYGIVKPSNRILERGTPTVITSHNIETATTMYAGRLVKKGTTDYDIVVSDGVSPVIGWLGWEQADMNNRPATVDTIYATSEEAPVLRGGNFNIVASLAVGFVAARGDVLIPWGSGTVAPAVQFPEGWGVKIPFIKKTSEYTTGVVLPTGIRVNDVWVYVVTNASATIDIGLLSSASGDADGFLDGEDLTNAGWVNHNLADATAGNITLGELLTEVEIKDTTGSPVYTPIKTPYIVGATAKSVTYTTTDATVAGNFYVVVSSPGTFPVAIAEQPIDASAAAADIVVRSLI
jgi:hypothetical protein